MDLIAEGVKRRIIRFEDGEKYIVYLPQEKRRNYENPEEKVQADAFLRLVLIYQYPVKRIRQYVSVQMGSETREADIIVYDDDSLTSPLIIAECKHPDVSELEFRRAVDQAFSYAVAEGAKFAWITSKLKDEYYEVPPKKPKERITVPDVPQFGVSEVAAFKFAFEGGTTKQGQKLFELEIVTQDELTRRFQQAHQALWGGGELNPSEAFDELDKLIFCKLWDERKPRKPGDPYDFQIFTFCNPNVYHEIGFIMGKAKAEAKDAANILLFLDESVPDERDKFVGFNLRDIKQLRFTRTEDFANDLRKNIELFFNLHTD
jgi:type I restriction enzyme M protein